MKHYTLYISIFLLVSPLYLFANSPNVEVVKEPQPYSLSQDIKSILNQYHINSSKHTLEEAAIKGMLDGLKDPHTKYIDAKTFHQMQDTLNNKTAQIGVEIGLRESQFIITTVHPNTPAAKSGIKPLDRLIAINGKPINDRPLFEIETLLLGEVGQRIDLTLRRLTTAKPIHITLIRENISINPIAKHDTFYDQIGYIKLTSFLHPDTDRLFQNELEQLLNKRVHTLILDLRSNSGGLLKHALSISSLFIESGTITTITKKDRAPQPLQARGNPIGRQLKLVVLINNGTASSSEILASALRAHQNAVLVGTPSFGKASVQQVFPLQNGGALVCTIAEYLTAENDSISKKGLQPDILRPIPENIQDQQSSPYYRYTYESDVQLMSALHYALLNSR